MVFPGGSAVTNPPAMQESQERQGPSLGHKDRREEGMATLSSILSWRIPWREEPAGLQSIGSAKSLTDATYAYSPTGNCDELQ